MEKLAIEGGQPIRETMLAYGKQSIDENDIQAVTDVLRSPFLTQGPMIEQFENAVACYVGTDHAVAFTNGTAALHAAYYAAGITVGDEVITTPITFVATSNAALYLGSKPVFADIDSETYNLSVESAEKNITSRTKAIVSVDFTGQPVDYQSFQALAKKNDLVYISDGAHSLGSRYKGKPVGSQADMTMFSFHPVKPITSGEGGMIVTDNAEYANRMRLFRSHGITKPDGKEEGPWFYEMRELGMNYRMTDLQAALGLSQLRKLDSFIERRHSIAQMYTKEFDQVSGLTVPKQLSDADSGWHLYMLRFDLTKFKVGRRTLFEALRSENIGVHVHYIPVYRQPYYQQLGYRQDQCPNADKWYEEVITLPLFPEMSDEDVIDVIKAIKKVVSNYQIFKVLS